MMLMRFLKTYTTPKKLGYGITFFVIGGVFSLSLYINLHRIDQDQLQYELDAKALERVEALEETLAEVGNSLNAVRDLLTIASETVTQEEFDVFASDLLQHQSEIESLMWIAAGKQGIDLEPSLVYTLMEQEVHKELATSLTDRYGKGFTFTQLLSSETESVIHSLYQESGQHPGHNDIVLIHPVYKAMEFDAFGVHSNFLLGYVVAEVDVAELIENSLKRFVKTSAGLDIHVYNAPSAGDGQLLYFHSSRIRKEASKVTALADPDAAVWSTTSYLDVGEKHWRIVFTPIEQFIASYFWFPKLVLAIGLMTSALFGSYVQILINRRSAIEHEVKLRTAALAENESYLRNILDTAVDGIITIDHRGIIQLFNPAAERIFGYVADEVIGNNISMLMPELEPDRSAHDSHISNYLKSGEARIIGTEREVRGKRKDGSTFPMDLAVSEFRLGNKIQFTCIVRDITAQKEAEQSLRDSEERFKHSQRLANIGSWDLDLKTGHLYWSERFGPLLGLEAGEHQLYSWDFINYIHPDDRQKVLEAKDTCIQGSVEYRVEYRVIWPDGTVHWLVARGDVVREEAGVAVRMLGVAGDITERKEAELALVEAKELAETANKVKSDFLSSMSHELRTPLNAIMGYAQLFSYDDNLTLQQQDNAEEIHSAGNHLLQLINDVLDLSKIEAGYVEMSFEPLSLEDMLAECRWITESLARKHSISLEFKCQGCFVQGDQTRLKQVLLNLLSNAVKYNRQGGSVSVVCKPGVEGQVQISVTDTGLGMTQAQLDNLFQPFNRLGAEAGDIEGTGIGLVITQRLIEMMSGAISVESTLGEGTSFYVSLPEAEAPSTAKHYQVVSASVDSVTVRLGHVLLVEDNPANQALFVQQLTMLGHRVSVAVNGEEGLRAWHAGDFDVVLSDINMPIMDGYAFVRSLREAEQEENLDRIPVIAITANALTGERERCLSAGMDDYISKPVDMATLKLGLNRWMPSSSTKANGAMEEAVATAPHQGVCSENDTPIDLAELIRMVGDNPDIHRSLLQIFVETTQAIIKQFHEAFSEKQAGVIGELGHKLKSSAGGMGATELAEVCVGLERAGKTENWTEIDHLVPRLDPLMDAVINYVDKLLGVANSG